MKRKIAVLGGGMAALAAVHELTRLPGWRDRFEITVYQMGWRLGGKGASGCNPEAHDRIEEHGLHVLWGFYENTFRLLRECYEELGRPPEAPLATLGAAFLPHDAIVLPERGAQGWTFRPMTCVRNAGVPGSGISVAEPWDYVGRLLRAVTELLGVNPDAPTRAALGEEVPRLRRLMDRVGRSVEGAAGAVAAALEGAVRTVVGRTAVAAVNVAQGLRELAPSLLGLELAGLIAADAAKKPALDDEAESREVLVLLDVVGASLRRYLGDRVDRRDVAVEVDLLLTIVRGLVADGLAIRPRDWFALDHESFRAWLARHGAAPETAGSVLVEALHAAAYCAGIDVGAGTLLHAVLRLAFTYQGAVLYKMAAGMGETVFAPMYEVLRRRGVRFEFFHAVDHLELSPDRRRVARVVLDRQATVRGPAYRPLYDVGGLPCWPSRPLLDQLEEGEALRAGGHDLEDWWGSWPGVERRVLHDGRDYDVVVLGIALGALRDVCAELCADAGNPRFGAMVENVRTVATASAQLWLDVDVARLGWKDAAPIVIPYAAPFDTWADMTHLLDRERWPSGARPGALAYLTARLDETEPVPPRGPSAYPARVRGLVATGLSTWLAESAHGLWPGATAARDPRALDWSRLHDPEARAGAARLGAQYVSPIPNPSNRYVIAAPGTNQHRLRPEESGYENLVLAGDWTLTSLSIGCMEAAAMSGNRAAAALDPGVRPAIGDWLTELDDAPREDRARATARPPRRVSVPPAAMPASLPAYISNGQLLGLPPLGMRTELAMFLLDADLGRLAALCDRCLNLPGSPVRYRPLGPHVVLYCSRAETVPLEEPIPGSCLEKDFGLWVPVVRTDAEGRERHLVFTPWLWVDSGVAMVGGREVYGFFKELGTLRMPERVEDPDVLSVDTMILPSFGPHVRAVERRLLDVRRSDGGAGARLRALFESGGHLLRSVDHLLAPGTPASYLGFLRATLERRELRMVFLKQLPDIVDGTRACYQAITEAPVRITSGMRGGLLPGEYRITLHTFASHPIVEALGLVTVDRTAAKAELRSVAHAWMVFDARVERGEVVFEATASRR